MNVLCGGVANEARFAVGGLGTAQRGRPRGRGRGAAEAGTLRAALRAALGAAPAARAA